MRRFDRQYVERSKTDPSSCWSMEVAQSGVQRNDRRLKLERTPVIHMRMTLVERGRYQRLDEY